MSKLTNFLKLFKYTQEDRDNNVNFNVEKSLNENWDKIEQNTVKANELFEQQETDINEIKENLESKADLIDGKVKAEQLPDMDYASTEHTHTIVDVEELTERTSYKYVKTFKRIAPSNMENKTWKLSFKSTNYPGELNGKLKLFLTSMYCNTNASAFIEKVYNIAVYPLTHVKLQYSSWYTNKDSKCANEFSIGEVFWDVDKWSILIKSKVPNSRNDFKLHVSLENKQDNQEFKNTLELSECYSDETSNQDNKIELATTERTPILCTPCPEFEIIEQDCFKNNNKLYIHVAVQREDGTYIDNSVFNEVVKLPIKIHQARVALCIQCCNVVNLCGSRRGGNAHVMNSKMIVWVPEHIRSIVVDGVVTL